MEKKKTVVMLLADKIKAKLDKAGNEGENEMVDAYLDCYTMATESLEAEKKQTDAAEDLGFNSCRIYER